MKKLLVGIALIVVVLAGVFAFRFAKPAANVQPETLTATQPAEKAPASQSSAAVPASRLSAGLPALFESSPNLRKFFGEISGRAHAGNAEAMWWSYRTLEYCKTYSRNPAAFSRDTEAMTVGLAVQLSTAVRGARGRIESRCNGFAADEIPSDSDLADYVSATGKAGSLAAKALAISMGLKEAESAAYVSEVLANVRSSQDAEAFLAISDAMGVASSGRSELFGMPSGSDYATYAWQLAACSRGLDCSANGSLMTSYCVNGGVCGQFSDFRDLVFNGLVPRADAGRVRDLISRI